MSIYTIQPAIISVYETLTLVFAKDFLKSFPFRQPNSFDLCKTVIMVMWFMEIFNPFVEKPVKVFQLETKVY